MSILCHAAKNGHGRAALNFAISHEANDSCIFSILKGAAESRDVDWAVENILYHKAGPDVCLRVFHQVLEVGAVEKAFEFAKRTPLCQERILHVLIKIASSWGFQGGQARKYGGYFRLALKKAEEFGISKDLFFRVAGSTHIERPYEFFRLCVWAGYSDMVRDVAQKYFRESYCSNTTISNEKLSRRTETALIREEILAARFERALGMLQEGSLTSDLLNRMVSDIVQDCDPKLVIEFVGHLLTKDNLTRLFKCIPNNEISPAITECALALLGPENPIPQFFTSKICSTLVAAGFGKSGGAISRTYPLVGHDLARVLTRSASFGDLSALDAAIMSEMVDDDLADVIVGVVVSGSPKAAIIFAVQHGVRGESLFKVLNAAVCYGEIEEAISLACRTFSISINEIGDLLVGAYLAHLRMRGLAITRGDMLSDAPDLAVCIRTLRESNFLSKEASTLVGARLGLKRI